MSPYEARRKINHGNPSGLKWADEFTASGLSVDVERNVDQEIASVKEMEGKVRPVRKDVSTIQSRQTVDSNGQKIRKRNRL
jgi:hypothetical protein